MRVAVYIAWTKNEAAPELEWVLAQAMLAMSGSLGPLPGNGVVFAQHVRQRSLVQFGRAISFTFFIDQQRESDPGVFAKVASVTKVAEPYGHELGALVGQGLLVFAQLRDVLAAKDSTVVT